ncbi:MAG: hypothetical protein ACP5XB_23725 [Isosphaeraceae bacterium]
MGFDVYLVAFADKQPSGIPKSAILEIFGDAVLWENDVDRTWQSPRGFDCPVSLGDFKGDQTLVSCVSISKPLRDEALWDSLYRIMQLGNVALFFPGDNCPLIADESVASQLPEFDCPWRPIVVGSGNEIVEQIRAG